ncbi:hypothetical protein HY041_00910, partial [Candidatus Roizmanbacteria bacterium]|nr:hypothetical protein [Candidatus Roizmanbacteria bacterium]
MKKETISAIIFGIVLGSFLAIILITKNREQQLEKSKTIAPLEKGKQTSQATNLNIRQLEISEPGNKSIVYKNTIVIKGMFTKNSLIIVQSPIKDLVFKNENEEFSVDFPLVLGENIIRIGAYPQN